MNTLQRIGAASTLIASTVLPALGQENPSERLDLSTLSVPARITNWSDVPETTLLLASYHERVGQGGRPGAASSRSRMEVLSDRVRQYKDEIKTIKNNHQLETFGVAGAGVMFGMVIGYVLGVIQMASQIPVTKSKSETTETQSD
jgi:hypothetical protein